MPAEGSGIAKELASTLQLYLFCTSIEAMIEDRKEVVAAVSLWKKAILAGMDRVWMQRMSIVLVP